MTERPKYGTMGQRDVVEEAIAALRLNRKQIEKLLPFNLTIHLPPPEGRDPVVLEITRAKIRRQ